MLVLALITLLAGLSFGGQNKVVTRTFSWVDEHECTVKIDTSAANRVLWVEEGNTTYRYPLRAVCSFNDHSRLSEVKLYDVEGFEIGSSFKCLISGAFKSRASTCYYDVPSNPSRIYDFRSMSVTRYQ